MKNIFFLSVSQITKRRSNSNSTCWNELRDVFGLRFQARTFRNLFWVCLVKHSKRLYCGTELDFETIIDIYLGSKKMERGSSIQGRFDMKVHRLTKKLPKSSGCMEKCSKILKTSNEKSWY